MMLILLNRRDAMFMFAFAPESKPKRIHFPSTPSSSTVDSELLGPTQSSTELKVPPFFFISSFAQFSLFL